jgi:hypothetical protein
MTQTATSATFKLKLTTAQIINARYNTNTSVFVSAKQRIDEYCKAVPGAMDELLHAIRVFKKNNPALEATDIKLARAAEAKLTDIRIDDTMNRPLNWEHVLKIIRNFAETRVLAINVYQDTEAPGCWIAWDGQHTTIVLYIIYCMIYDESASNVIVPVVVSTTNDKSKIRENFIFLNTDEANGGGKKSLDPLDTFSQKVFGVRMDKSNNLDWRTAELKQQMLEAADLFLTSTAYQNTDAAGAITQVAAIIDEDINIVGNFCKYWNIRKKFENRHVESKELIMLNNFFRACAEDPSVVVDEKFITDMTAIFWVTFECEFTGQKGLYKFWRKLDMAYNNWYDKVYREPEVGEDDLRPKRLDMTKNGKHQDTYGTTFMIYVLMKHGFKQTLPKPLNEFKPAKADLW